MEPTLELSAPEWAWIAGLLDGEAFIGLVLLKNDIYSQGRYWSPRIRVHMTHERTILKLQELLGGTVRENKSTKRGRQTWAWECSRSVMLQILKGVTPYSVTKNEAVVLLTFFIEYRMAVPARERRASDFQDVIAEKIRALTATTRQLRKGE